MMKGRTTTYQRFGSERKVSEREKPEETLTEEELEILGQVLDNLVAGELGSGPASDPDEQVNLYATAPLIAARLRTFLTEGNALRVQPVPPGGAAPDEGALGDLGYTGDDSED